MVVPAGTQHQFVNTGPTPLVRNLLNSLSVQLLKASDFRFSTQSILQPSMPLKPSTKQKRKETRRKKTE